MKQFAMKLMREDEKGMLQFAKGHPLASNGRLFNPHRANRKWEDALSNSTVESGVRRIVILARRTRHVSLSGIMAHDKNPNYEVGHTPRKQAWRKAQRLPKINRTSAWLILDCQYRFRAGRCGREASRRRMSQTRPRFSLGSGVPYLDNRTLRKHLVYMYVNPEIGRGVPTCEPHEAFSEEPKAIRKGEDPNSLRKLDERLVRPVSSQAGIASDSSIARIL